MKSARDKLRSSYRHMPIIIGLLLTTVLPYWQVHNHDFISYDDPTYITQNKDVQKGLTLDGIIWAFTTGHASNWHPLTWISHMLDCQLFGLNAWGHHLMSLFFHIMNTVLLFLVLRRMTGLPAGGSLMLHSFSDGARFGPQACAVWQSAFVAALFALHPLHVESVAWAAERKDVLSTSFWFLTMFAYVHYVEKPETKRYVLVLILFALGLMAKPMLVTLPFVLLLLDYWPLGRYQGVTAGDVNKRQMSKIFTSRSGRSLLFRLVWEKIPMFGLVAASSAVTFVVQEKSGAMATLEGVPFGARIGNAAIAYIRYIEKMVWPSDLAVFYPHPGYALSMWQVVIASLALVSVTVLVIRRLPYSPYLPIGWLWYLGTLVPVIGLVHVGGQSMADRYTYIPLIGLFIIIAWGIPDFLKRWPHRVATQALLGSTVLVAYAILTWQQVGYWRDSTTLFDHAIKSTAENWVAHLHMGLALDAQGKTVDAIRRFSEAVRIKPKNEVMQNNLGASLWKQGRYEEALTHCAEALRLKPDYADAHNNMGMILGRQGRMDEALTHFKEAIRINPSLGDAHYNLGLTLAREGRLEEAIAAYREALRINPQDHGVRLELDKALQLQKHSDSP